jgi:hypothetical protein
VGGGDPKASEVTKGSIMKGYILRDKEVEDEAKKREKQRIKANG